MKICMFYASSPYSTCATSYKLYNIQAVSESHGGWRYHASEVSAHHTSPPTIVRMKFKVGHIHAASIIATGQSQRSPEGAKRIPGFRYPTQLNKTPCTGQTPPPSPTSAPPELGAVVSSRNPLRYFRATFNGQPCVGTLEASVALENQGQTTVFLLFTQPSLNWALTPIQRFTGSSRVHHRPATQTNLHEKSGGSPDVASASSY